MSILAVCVHLWVQYTAAIFFSATWCLFVTANFLIGSAIFVDYSVSATILLRTSVVVHSKAAHRHRARRRRRLQAQRDPLPRAQGTLDTPHFILVFLLSIQRMLRLVSAASRPASSGWLSRVACSDCRNNRILICL